MDEVPDIVLEIVLTSGTINKLNVYRGLNVKEVWFWENQQLHLYGLIDTDTGYEKLLASRLLPQLNVALLTSFIDNLNQTQAVKASVKR